MMPFGLKISIISRAFRKRLDEKAAALGLTSVQLRVLGSISRLEAAGEQEIHQKDLERIEHVTHPAMTRLLQRLESKGFVRCLPSSQDRRYKRITCTEKSAGIHEMILQQDQEGWRPSAPISPRPRKKPFSSWPICCCKTSTPLDGSGGAEKFPAALFHAPIGNLLLVYSVYPTTRRFRADRKFSIHIKELKEYEKPRNHHQP